MVFVALAEPGDWAVVGAVDDWSVEPSPIGQISFQDNPGGVLEFLNYGRWLEVLMTCEQD